ncbi:MAG: TonB-dependent receptor [Gemmatimonadaceae bacterium]|nr:TonB-dependent receptor [Gemmatimonadaceae bacterium]
MLHFTVRRLLPVLASVVFAATAAAQGGSLTGRVTTKDAGRPLDNARVTISDGARAVGVATSGEAGVYVVPNIAAGSYTVTISRIGYQLQRFPATAIQAGQATTLNAVLDEIPTQLNAVVTTASRKPEKALDAPASLSVVTRETIERKPSISVADLVKGQPGIDVSNGGIAQSMIVARGFNNAFSGSLLMLQDYRFAGVPSLRVNVPYLSLGQSEDIERVELLLGPASALYGPNSGAGVLHVITKSPFSSQGTTLSLQGGQQSIFRGAIRHAGTAGKHFGYKLSGEYMRGDDFQYNDPGEPAQISRPASPGATPTLTANQRDFFFERLNGEARMDIRPTDNSELITTVSMTKVPSAIELTGANGASQVRNWTYQNFQQRVRIGRLFLQGFANVSNAGNENKGDSRGTFLLRNGQPIVDKSRVYTGQIQHGFGLNKGRTDFVYGVDFIKTNPQTGNTINGNNEDVDDVTEYGGYVQGKTALSSRWDFLAALRVDKTSVIKGEFVSPRAALTYRAADNQSLRFTFNRSFNTPANFSFFLDLPSVVDAAGFRRTASLTPFNLPTYDVIATGNRPKVGMSFDRSCSATSGFGNFCMRSPFINNGGTVVGASAATALPAFVAFRQPVFAGALAQGYAPALAGLSAIGLSPTAIAGLAQTLGGAVASRLATNLPTNAQIGTVGRLGSASIDANAVTDLPPLNASFDNTFEVGYKGLGMNGKLSFDFSAWAQQRGGGAITASLVTPWIFANPTQTGAYVGAQAGAALAAAIPAYVTAEVTAGRLSPAQGNALASALGASATALATGAATNLTPLLAGIPLGTVGFTDAINTNYNLRATYRRVEKTVEVWGSDLGLSYQFTQDFALDWTASVVNRVVFDEIQVGTSPLSLNAPGAKTTLTARYQGLENGYGFETRWRYTDAFPVNSGVYESDVQNPSNAGPFKYAPVAVSNQFDVQFSKRFQTTGTKGVVFSVNVQNIFDNKVATFVGVPALGRLALTKLSYTF